MGKQGTLTVRVLSDTKPLESGMDRAAKKVATTGDKFEAAGKKLTVFATVPVAAAMGFAVNAASDLNETLSKSNTVFGKSAKTIENWADGAVDDFGQSKREALDAASTFGNLFVQLGIGADQAAEMSMEMTELASDFASFHNADITQVLEAQTAAFRGEYDALQRFVPTINAATVEQRALEMTGKATTKELTAQEKALAVNKIMFENAGDAIGDFDRTQDSAANQTRKAKAAMEDAAAELGSSLLPIMAKAAGGVADLASAFADLPEPIQTGIVALAGLLATAGPLMTVGGKIANNWSKVSAAFDKGSVAAFNAAGNWKKLAVQGGALAAATIAVTKAVEAYGSEMDAAASDGESAGKKIVGSFDAQKASADEFAAEMNRLTDAHNSLIDDANNAKNPFLKERFLEAAETVAVARREMDTTWDSAFKLRDELGITGDEALRMATDVDVTAAATDELTGELDTSAAALEVEQQRIEETSQAFSDLADEMAAQFDPLFSARRATEELADAQARALEVANDSESTAREVADANREVAEAALGNEQAQLELRAAIESGEVSLDAAKGKLREWVAEGALTEEQAAQVAEEFGAVAWSAYNLPKSIHIPVGMDISDFNAKMESIRSQLSGISESEARVLLERDLALSGRRHGGGPVHEGRPYIVGKSGAEELFVPGESGHIVPHSSLRRSGGTGSTDALIAEIRGLREDVRSMSAGDVNVVNNYPRPETAESATQRAVRKAQAVRL